MKYFLKNMQYYKAHLVVFLLAVGQFSQVKAQENYRWLIQAIDSNNASLSAYIKNGEAQKMLNRTGLTLPNPEVGVNYLKLKPRLANQRLDYNVSQGFEFPTVYGYRKKISAQQNEIVDTDNGIYRANLINQAINAYLLWVYYNQLGKVLEQQKDYATNISSSYQKAFAEGAVNILERNKAQINAVNAQKAFELNAIEINAVYHELIRYNKGRTFENLPTEFPDSRTIGDLNSNEAQKIANNKEIKSISQETALSATQEKLVRAEGLPEFSVGYMREQDVEVNFQGVMLGMSIPLWQKRNTKQAARLKTEALKHVEEDTRQQYIMYISAQQKKAADLYVIMNQLEQTISQTRGLELLKKALDLKEITILEYLVEQSMYFDLTQKYLETTLDYHVILADLNRWNY